jgi:single-stranded DNA-binding protein
MTTVTTKAPTRGPRRIIAGVIARELVLRLSREGVIWCTTTIACGDGETCELVLFGDVAEDAAQSFGKGSRVVASGRMRTERLMVNSIRRGAS